MNWHNATMAITKVISAAQNKGTGDFAASKGLHEDAASFWEFAFRDAERAANHALRFLEQVEECVKAETGNGSLVFDSPPTEHQTFLHRLLFFWQGQTANAVLLYVRLGIQTGKDAAALREAMNRLRWFSGTTLSQKLWDDARLIHDQLTVYENECEA